MKKYIDYLFWKRTWFRVAFVAIPIPEVVLLIILLKSGVSIEIAKLVFVVVYVMFFGLGVNDNSDMDSPANPFVKKKKVKSTFLKHI